jgi:hypothetical protein
MKKCLLDWNMRFSKINLKKEFDMETFLMQTYAELMTEQMQPYYLPKS